MLVCDDEPQIVRALKVLLREAGFDSVVAETAEQAIDRASVRPPDAAIIDLVLPDGDGIEVTRQLREWSQMPIIVLSAIGEEDEKVRALQAGADDYVTKPLRRASWWRASKPPCAVRAPSRTSPPSRRTGWRSTSPPAWSAATATRST